MEKSLNNIFLLINNTLSDLSFIDKHRLSNTAFIRNRSLNFSTLILYLLNFRKHSNQVELDQFFKAINHKKEASQWITKSAFFQSRKQLSHTAFIGLNHLVIDSCIHPKLKSEKSCIDGHMAHASKNDLIIYDLNSINFKLDYYSSIRRSKNCSSPDSSIKTTTGCVAKILFRSFCNQVSIIC